MADLGGNSIDFFGTKNALKIGMKIGTSFGTKIGAKFSCFLPEAKPTGLVAVMSVRVNKPREAFGSQLMDHT